MSAEDPLKKSNPGCTVLYCSSCRKILHVFLEKISGILILQTVSSTFFLHLASPTEYVHVKNCSNRTHYLYVAKV